MFRREMGSKRGSLPPKEGDLTCMLLASIICVKQLHLVPHKPFMIHKSNLVI